MRYGCTVTVPHKLLLLHVTLMAPEPEIHIPEGLYESLITFLVSESPLTQLQPP